MVGGFVVQPTPDYRLTRYRTTRYSMGMTTTEIPARIAHKGHCEHAQTPYARRVCRKAMVARAHLAVVVPTYESGDEMVIDGITVILCARRGNHGIRWTWWAPQLEEGGEAMKATPEEAIDYARHCLARRCSCGDLATMATSHGRSCIRCYDRKSA